MSSKAAGVPAINSDFSPSALIIRTPFVFSVTSTRPSGNGAIEKGKGSNSVTKVSMRKLCREVSNSSLGTTIGAS